MKIIQLSFAAVLLLSLGACKKSSTNNPDNNSSTSSGSSQATNKSVLNDLANNVINASYSDLSSKANTLYTSLVAFSASPNANNLATAQQAWRNVRTVYEQTEGFLFGPMKVNNIDPRVDTWPIDFARLDSLLSSANTPTPFTASYVDGLEESLKGFHPIEYFLFGSGGNKTSSQFTSRQLDLMTAMAQNLKDLCAQVQASWDPNTTNNYTSILVNAGSNTTYATQRAAFEEVINAMIDICDEVANGKMHDPFAQKDPSLEESPFSKNSLTDFSNNIKSVQNMYLGRYIADGKGLEDLIKVNNISMDGNIKTKINAALTALGNITVPFGQAISDTNGQRTLVQNAMSAVNDLHDYLAGDVKKYLQTITN